MRRPRTVRSTKCSSKRSAGRRRPVFPAHRRPLYRSRAGVPSSQHAVTRQPPPGLHQMRHSRSHDLPAGSAIRPDLSKQTDADLPHERIVSARPARASSRSIGSRATEANRCALWRLIEPSGSSTRSPAAASPSIEAESSRAGDARRESEKLGAGRGPARQRWQAPERRRSGRSARAANEPGTGARCQRLPASPEPHQLEPGMCSR